MADKSGKFTDEWGRSAAKTRYGKPHEPSLSQKSEEAPQAECDKRGPDYDNNTSNNWLRGANENATTKPGFDKGK